MVSPQVSHRSFAPYFSLSLLILVVTVNKGLRLINPSLNPFSGLEADSYTFHLNFKEKTKTWKWEEGPIYIDSGNI